LIADDKVEVVDTGVYEGIANMFENRPCSGWKHRLGPVGCERAKSDTLTSG
jgi:hypothetical protein